MRLTKSESRKTMTRTAVKMVRIEQQHGKVSVSVVVGLLMLVMGVVIGSLINRTPTLADQQKVDDGWGEVVAALRRGQLREVEQYAAEQAAKKKAKFAARWGQEAASWKEEAEYIKALKQRQDAVDVSEARRGNPTLRYLGRVSSKDAVDVSEERRGNPSPLADNAGSAISSGSSDMEPVIVFTTSQSAGHVTEADLDQTMLNNLESWVVETALAKSKDAYAEIGNDLQNFKPTVASNAVYITVGERKLAVIRVNLHNTVRVVTILGINGNELHRVNCIRGSNHDIPLFRGECGNKVQSVFGVSIQP